MILFRRVMGAGFLLSTMGTTCGQSTIGLLPGVINDPQNLTLRREILAFGTRSFCDEVLGRSVPLRMNADEAGIGRFFPTQCFAQEAQAGRLLVQFSGQGYGWTQLTKRGGFEASAAIEYEADFQVKEGKMYVYFRPVSTTATNFKTLSVEAPLAASILGSPMGDPMSAFGVRIMQGVVDKGFTVIRQDSGTAAFSLGLVPLGQAPPAPFHVAGDEREVLGNDRSDIYPDQRDYVGPLTVREDGEPLALDIVVESAPVVDAMLYPAASANPWLTTYIAQAALTPPEPTAPPILSVPVTAGVPFRHKVRLPKGQYFLVLDHTRVAGPSAPQDARPASVRYLVLGSEN